MKLGRKSEVHSHAAPAVVPLAAIPNANAAAFPHVNLVPASIAQEGKLRTAKFSVVASILVSLMAVAGLYVMSQGQVTAAQAQLDTATAQVATLNAQLDGFKDFKNASADVVNAQKQLDLAMGGEVRWSSLINDVSLTMPAGTSLTEFKGSIDGISPTIKAAVTDLIAQAKQKADAQAAAAAAGNTGGTSAAPPAISVPPIVSPTSVLGNSGIGLITYSGEASNYAAVASFLDVVSKQHTMLDPYPNNIQVNNAAGGSGAAQGLTFSATVTINEQALSHRFTVKAGS